MANAVQPAQLVVFFIKNLADPGMEELDGTAIIALMTRALGGSLQGSVPVASSLL